MQFFASLGLPLGKWDDSFYQILKRVGDREKVKKYLFNPITFQMRNQPPGNAGNCQGHTGNARVRIAYHHTSLPYGDPRKQIQRYFNILKHIMCP